MRHLVLTISLLLCAALAAAPVPGSPLLASSGGAEVRDEFRLQGFRSAKFGMTEPQVRAAMAKDFKLRADDIRSGAHPVERTRLLVADVPGLLPGGGTAEATYVLGYESETLIQVGLAWSTARDRSLTADRLVANADLLSRTLRQAGYRPDTVVVNAPLETGGLLVFRGSDVDGRTAALILQGDVRQGAKEGEVRLTPNSLTLVYVANPENPDVFRIAPGNF